VLAVIVSSAVATAHPAMVRLTKSSLLYQRADETGQWLFAG
jgi:hypothetical protein